MGAVSPCSHIHPKPIATDKFYTKISFSTFLTMQNVINLAVIHFYSKFLHTQIIYDFIRNTLIVDKTNRNEVGFFNKTYHGYLDSGAYENEGLQQAPAITT